MDGKIDEICALLPQSIKRAHPLPLEPRKSMSALPCPPSKIDNEKAAIYHVALRKELPEITVLIYTDESRMQSGDTRPFWVVRVIG